MSKGIPFTPLLTKNMKKNVKKTIYTTIVMTGLMGVFSLGVLQIKENKHEVYAEQEKVEFHQDNRKFVSYDDEQEAITLNDNEINNYIWHNFYNFYNSLESKNYISIYFDSGTYAYDGDGEGTFDFTLNDNVIYFITNINTFNNFIGPSHDFVNYQFSFNGDLVDDTLTLIVEDGDDTYLNLKQAIELDIQANSQSDLQGENIVEAITDGLGLIPDLANEFLKGFSALFWDSTNSKLTTFSTFALVFLGIAITMAVIKLCLNILRGSTGA